MATLADKGVEGLGHACLREVKLLKRRAKGPVEAIATREQVKKADFYVELGVESERGKRHQLGYKKRLTKFMHCEQEFRSGRMEYMESTGAGHRRTNLNFNPI